MSECGFRIERGSYFLGPCRLPLGHDERHDPYTPEERTAIDEYAAGKRETPFPDARSGEPT